MEENRIGESPADMEYDRETDESILKDGDSIGEEPEKAENIGEEERQEASPGKSKTGEREEYDDLIKNRFRSFYAEDTQRLINRRFRKYKVMEERFRLLEETLAQKEAVISENAQKIADFQSVLRSEVEKAVKETEERVISEIRNKQLRPSENGTAPGKRAMNTDVSRLTRSDRATLARRAASGERIKL